LASWPHFGGGAPKGVGWHSFCGGGKLLEAGCVCSVEELGHTNNTCNSAGSIFVNRWFILELSSTSEHSPVSNAVERQWLQWMLHSTNRNLRHKMTLLQDASKWHPCSSVLGSCECSCGLETSNRNCTWNLSAWIGWRPFFWSTELLAAERHWTAEDWSRRKEQKSAFASLAQSRQQDSLKSTP